MPLLRALAVLVCVLFAGCLEVESLEVQVVADPAADRLDLMVVSRGLWSSASGADNLAKDLADLKRLRDVSALPFPGLGVIDLTRQDDGSWPEFARLLDIEPGAFFSDEQGRLCFYQFVRVPSVQALVTAAGARARQQMAKEAADPKVAKAQRELLAQAVAGGLQVLGIHGAGFVVRWPMTDDEHRSQQAGLWRRVVQAVAQDAQAASERGVVAALRENDIAIVRRPGVTEFVVGTQGGLVCDYQLRGAPAKANLAEALAAEEPKPPAVGQTRIDAEFAAFRGRAARLPVPYQQVREAKAEPASAEAGRGK